MSNFFVFDFDGVVCDSTNECLVCSSNAMKKYEGKTNYKYYLSDFSNEFRSRFSTLRPFVKGGSQYYTLYKILNSDINIEQITQQTFDELHKNFLQNLKYISHIFTMQEMSFKNLIFKLAGSSYSLWVGY